MDFGVFNFYAPVHFFCTLNLFLIRPMLMNELMSDVQKFWGTVVYFQFDRG